MSRRAVAVALALVALGCGKNKRSYVAELIERDATVERRSGEEHWASAAVGDDFVLGDAVRTGKASRAKLKFREGGVLSLDPETVVKFQHSPARNVSLDVETGAVELESTDDGFEIDTSFGVAVLERSGSVRMSAEDGALKLEVLVGTVVIDSEGDATTLEAGQGISIDVGGAIIEDDAPPPPDKVAAAPPPDAGAPAEEPPDDAISATVGGKGNKVLTKSGWKKLDAGEAQLEVGARVRVARRGSLEVVRGDERAVVRGTAEVVVGGPDGSLLDAVRGEVTVTATTQNVAIKVPGGVIVARAAAGGTVAGIDVAKNGQSVVTARRGSVQIETRRGKEALRTGESADLSRGGAVVVSGRAPARVDFSFPAGESPVVHDPDAPTAIRIKFAGSCSGEGVVEIARGNSFKRPAFVSAGNGGANVVIARGSHKYRVRCPSSKKPVASGRITVNKDSGRRQLPKIAAHNVLDADGRRYRVLYQNLLPELTFVWPDAPRTGPYTLHVVPKRGSELTVDNDKPRARVASGKLGEGDYTWWFAGGGQTSKKTPLIIDFDNAAATAYLSRPTAGEGGATHVEGAVIEDWSVSAGGRELPLDRHERFQGDLKPSGDELAIAIRIAHPKRGVHYYLVRAPKR